MHRVKISKVALSTMLCESKKKFDECRELIGICG